jgi:N-acetylneuraminic acid mutarotase
VTTLGDGAAYDPVARSWTLLAALGSPSGRYWHTAVWTGQEMIVWGGTHDGTAPLGDGAAYDPSAGTWTPISANNAPEARYSHSAVWTGTEMIVWGGLGCAYSANGTTAACSDGGAYDPATHRWRSLATDGAPRPSSGSQATWADAKMLVWGGDDSPVGGVYDPRADGWMPMTTAGQPMSRSGHLALWTGTELLVWGGLVSGNEAIDGGRFAPSP